MYCSKCGTLFQSGDMFCSKCGCNANTGTSGAPNYPHPLPQAKSKIVAGILGIIIGVWGVHNFYLGFTGKAVAQLLLGTVGIFILIGPAISGIWGFIEGLIILCSNDPRDAKGMPLRD